MRIEVSELVRISCMSLVLCSGVVQAATFEVNYVTPTKGAPLVVSAPEPTSTPLVVYILQGGQAKTAAVLGTGLFRMKSIIADGRLHPDVANNPKAKALPSEATLLVRMGEPTKFVVRSHDELVSGGPFGPYTTASCATPFMFVAREGYQYRATYAKTTESCSLLVTERAIDPADAPEVALNSLEPANAAK
jgi:hypothetical protein